MTCKGILKISPVQVGAAHKLQKLIKNPPLSQSLREVRGQFIKYLHFIFSIFNTQLVFVPLKDYQNPLLIYSDN